MKEEWTPFLIFLAIVLLVLFYSILVYILINTDGNAVSNKQA